MRISDWSSDVCSSDLTRKQIERPIGLGDEARERLPPVTTLHIVAAFDQRAARGVGLVGRRQEGQRYMVAALEMRPRLLEARAPFPVAPPGCRTGPRTVGVAHRLQAPRLEMKRPARPATLDALVPHPPGPP